MTLVQHKKKEEKNSCVTCPSAKDLSENPTDSLTHSLAHTRLDSRRRKETKKLSCCVFFCFVIQYTAHSDKMLYLPFCDSLRDYVRPTHCTHHRATRAVCLGVISSQRRLRSSSHKLEFLPLELLAPTEATTVFEPFLVFRVYDP